MFETLSDRLTSVFSSLRSKGRLSEADIDATAREIRIALLEADVALPVVKDVRRPGQGARPRRRGLPGAQPRPAGRQDRQRRARSRSSAARPAGSGYAKTPPTVIMLAGLQGAGKTTLAGKLARWLREQGHTPLLVAADLQRPNAVQQLQVVGERARRRRLRARARQRRRRPGRRRPPVDRRTPGGSSTTSSSSTPRAASASTRR